MSDAKKTKGAKALLALKGLDVLLDTNALILGFSQKKKEQAEVVQQFCKQNKVYITDTVYWEFLRNTNVHTFRSKHCLIHEMGNPAAPIALLHESHDEVRQLFELLSLEQLYVHRSDPTQYAHLRSEDRWIVASALAHSIELILTAEESADFLPEIFDVRTYELGRSTPVRTYRYNPEKEEQLLSKIAKKDGILIDAKSLLL